MDNKYKSPYTQSRYTYLGELCGGLDELCRIVRGCRGDAAMYELKTRSYVKSAGQLGRDGFQVLEVVRFIGRKESTELIKVHYPTLLSMDSLKGAMHFFNLKKQWKNNKCDLA